MDEGEDSPEGSENAEGNSEFFGEGEANDFGEIVQDQIEEDVIPLPGEIEAGSFALVDEFGEPGIIGVTAEIAGLDVGVPEARDEEKDGDQREEKNGAAEDKCHCDEDSIARMGGGKWPLTDDQWPVKRLARAPCKRKSRSLASLGGCDFIAKRRFFASKANVFSISLCEKSKESQALSMTIQEESERVLGGRGKR